MALLDNIKRIAKQHGYNLTEVNDRAGLGKNTIYSWKLKTPSTENLQKVAQVLQVSLEELLGESKPKEETIDITQAIQADKLLAYEGRRIPPEEIEMIRRIIEGRRYHG
ncbi:helix-turn-helix transcriptional regulator [Lactobacillus sp. DCY120]|uniref:Helix-turn-helix transcriptional regulator n=1 Tax=Bombilactobacillus apium TaxID=2675299 RepID=A0A850R3S2_9LACO|nr:helix-turn-helix transcriptional regulator [Bombilactobacillus apium]NVY96621.1 helix-turn-helix transcriptional regulator [Bombilactobacillus apium]